VPSRWSTNLILSAAILCCGLPGLGHHAEAGEVLLLRHADKDRLRGDFNLSPRGFLRAIALAQLIPACFGAPTTISTYNINPFTGKNARSYQSAVPLAVTSGINIRIITTSPEHAFDFGKELQQRIAATTGLHVIFWEHKRIPELARGLGWTSMPPIGDDDFDQLILLRYEGDSDQPSVQRFSQAEQFRKTCFTAAWQSSPFKLDLSPLLGSGSTTSE